MELSIGRTALIVLFCKTWEDSKKSTEDLRISTEDLEEKSQLFCEKRGPFLSGF